MAKNCADEKWDDSNSEKEEEEEEALSLCDLPVSLVNEDNQSRKQAQALEAQEDFDFGSLGGPLPSESDMCAADDVFFQGQILPLRLSVSSDSGLAGSQSRNPSRCVSRSESMDHGSTSGGLTSISSRSSSTRSHNSSSSSTTTTTTSYKPRVRNRFHAHPSPTPQIRIPNTRAQNAGGRSRKSTVWDIFRLGLVRTPEIELQDLKLHGNNNSNYKSFGSRNSSRSSNSSCSTKGNKIISGSDDSGRKSFDGLNMEKEKRQRLFNRNGGFLSGCRCSVGAVEVPSKIVVVKSSGGRNSNVSETPVKEEKQQRMKQKQKQQEQPQEQQGKQSMSRHRTFEWLKELSHAGALDEP